MANKLSIEKLRETDAFQALSVRCQQMVETYLQTGSKVKAVMAVSSGKESSSRTQSYFYFARIDVLECLEVARGVDPQAAHAAAERLRFDADLNKLIGSKTTTKAQLAAMKLKAEINGYIMPAVPADASEPSTEFQIPEGATALVDKAGVVKGYRTAEGAYVQRPSAEVSQ
jgi:hypothetical protein